MGKVINLNEYRRKKKTKENMNKMKQITFADIDPLHQFIEQIQNNDDYIQSILIKEKIDDIPDDAFSVINLPSGKTLTISKKDIEDISERLFDDLDK